MAKLPRPKDFKDTRQLPSEHMISEIGRIAIVSASIEDLMHSLYWQLAGLDERMGSLITRDIKATRLSEEVVKVAEIAGVEAARIQDLKDIFSDFARLAKTRNEYVHWIWSWNTETHEDRIDPPAYKLNAKGRYIKDDEITNTADDLVWVEHRLSVHLFSEAELEASMKKYGSKGAPDAPTPWL